MKKLLSALLLSFVTAIFLTGCGGESDNGTGNNGTTGDNETNGEVGDTLHLFNWGLFLEPELTQRFYEEYGIRVITSYYASNEELYSRLTAGTDTFDVLVPSDYMVYRLIAEDLLRPLNWDNLPNVEHIYDRLMDQPFDPNNVYSAPYKWGTLGILYNTTMVSEPVTSWDALFNPDYAGQIFMYNSERDAFAVAFSRMGVSLNTTDENYINQARDMLIDQLPLLQAYVTDNVIPLMTNGDGALALVYSGDATLVIRSNPDLNYVIPEEGSNLWINSLVIPHNAPNPLGAEKFINFLMRPDIAAINTNWVHYTTANQTAIESGEIDEEITSLPSFNIRDEDLERLEVYIDLGEDRELITNAFTSVLAHE